MYIYIYHSSKSIFSYFLFLITFFLGLRIFFILVSDLLNPTSLINAKEATYLISEELKSPMGENLSAFKNKEVISYKGNIYNWKSIKEQIRK